MGSRHSRSGSYMCIGHLLHHPSGGLPTIPLVVLVYPFTAAFLYVCRVFHRPVEAFLIRGFPLARFPYLGEKEKNWLRVVWLQADLLWLMSNIFAWSLLLAVFLVNLAFVIGRLMAGMASKLMTRLVGAERDELWPQPSRRRTLLGILYTLVWLVGVVGCLFIAAPGGLSIFSAASYIVVFLAFRGGANVARRVVLGLHDRRVISETQEEGELVRPVARAVGIGWGLGLAASVIFMAAWAVVSQLLSAGIRTTFGLSYTPYSFSLWAGGAIFGLLHAWVLSRGEKALLLRDELAVASLLTLRGVVRMMEEKALQPLAVGAKGVQEVQRRAGQVLRRTGEAATTVTGKASEAGRRIRQDTIWGGRRGGGRCQRACWGEGEDGKMKVWLS